MKRRQGAVGFLWLAVAVGVLAGSCASKKNADPVQPSVGFVVKTLNNPFFVEMREGAERAARSLGIELLVQASDREMDAERQLQIVENFIERGVSVICLAPHGAKEAIPAIVRANSAGVPVIIVDSRVDAEALRESGGHIVSFVGSDNVQGGRLAGEWMLERLGAEARLAVLEGPAGHETGSSRLKGFRDALGSQVEARIVSSQSASFERSQGFVVFQNILQAHPDVAGVFACNDLMALGAVEAIAAAGRQGTIAVVGFDAIEEALEAIRRGQMEATVAQYPGRMGEVAVRLASKAIRGEPVPTEVPVSISLVTRDSLAEAAPPRNSGN